jgi:putative ABC transport system substrate-binding protein
MKTHPFLAAALALVMCLAPWAAMADDHATVTETLADFDGSAASVGALFNRIEGGTSLPQPAYKSMTLAQLEDQLRRPEMQASIGKGSIAVLYPNVAEPYRSAFVSMIQGIEERTRLRVRSYPVDAKLDVADLNSQLKRNGTRVVIALGR